jgi:hypothetical protein
VANVLIKDTIVKKKMLLILSMNLRDAFGSKSHDLINLNMEKVEIPEQIRKRFMNTYENAYINIEVTLKQTDTIHIGKGVKQGYP